MVYQASQSEDQAPDFYSAWPQHPSSLTPAGACYTFPMRHRDWLKLGRRLRIKDRYLFVVDQGKGPAILLLHGFPTSSHDFSKIYPL